LQINWNNALLNDVILSKSIESYERGGNGQLDALMIYRDKSYDYMVDLMSSDFSKRANKKDHITLTESTYKNWLKEVKILQSQQKLVMQLQMLQLN